MKISFNWLSDLVALPAGTTVTEVARRLTLGGLEVESIEALGRQFSGVRVAEVRAVRPHPGADKLRIVRLRVDPAASPEQESEVVCGAPNVPPPGGRVAWAAPGAVLPGGFKIGRKEIRGFDSPGMICSEKELGLSEAAAGIIILPDTCAIGADLAVALGIADDVLEVNVTPNRPDALSHAGVAREVAAAFQVAWRLPPTGFPGDAPVAATATSAEASVEVQDPIACPRYRATVIRGLRVGPSPANLRLRLTACGVRAISNLVDVTNYVMLETGHPLHAFDLDKLEGGIVVRRARAGETIETLDGVKRTLVADDIVIADARGPVALAGVMGGARTEVSDATVNVLLEAATFDPRSVRKTAKRFGLHSEASHRFERGVDAQGVPVAAARAAAMIAGLGGGLVVAAPVERAAPAPASRTITLPRATLRRVAGFDIAVEEARAVLRGIEFDATVQGDALSVTVPSFRPDVTIPEDLIEEIMRLVGLDRVPARLPQGGKAPETSPERLADRARDTLAALGLHEIAGWAFVPRVALAALGEPTLASGITVSNPISADYEVMRTSLLPGLAEAARRNLARGVADVRLFEVGPVVVPVAGDQHHRQTTQAAGLLLGRRPGWLKPGAPLDFFDLKQLVTELLASLGQRSPRFVVPAAGTVPAYLHPGIVAGLDIPNGDGWQRIGLAGELHPVVAGRLGLDGTALYFELGVDDLTAGGAQVRIVPPPRFPTVTRDVSFWIDAGVSAATQEAAMRGSGVELLQELAVLEDFRDARFVPGGKKGMLWTMVYRAADRTLTDVEVDTAHGHVVAALRQALSVELR